MSPELIQLALVLGVPAVCVVGILWSRRNTRKRLQLLEQNEKLMRSLNEFLSYRVPPSGSALIPRDFFNSLYEPPETKR